MIMSYHRAFNKSNTTDATNEAGHACPSEPELDFTPVFYWVRVAHLLFSVQCFSDHRLHFCHFLFWSWQCLYFFLLPLLVTTLLSFGHHFVIFKLFLCLEHASFINWLVKVTLLSINVQCRPHWHSEFKKS